MEVYFKVPSVNDRDDRRLTQRKVDFFLGPQNPSVRPSGQLLLHEDFEKRGHCTSSLYSCCRRVDSTHSHSRGEASATLVSENYAEIIGNEKILGAPKKKPPGHS